MDHLFDSLDSLIRSLGVHLSRSSRDIRKILEHLVGTFWRYVLFLDDIRNIRNIRNIRTIIYVICKIWLDHWMDHWLAWFVDTFDCVVLFWISLILYLNFNNTGLGILFIINSSWKWSDWCIYRCLGFRFWFTMLRLSVLVYDIIIVFSMRMLSIDSVYQCVCCCNPFLNLVLMLAWLKI